MGPRIEILNYNPGWPLRFAEEKAAILEAIGHWVMVIEHIGSTAVPGLGAKPIIDIMVGVRRLAAARYSIAPLAAIGYEYVPQFEDEMPERRYFRKGPQTRHFHLHMVELGSEFWQRHLAFRDYLCGHPEAVREYEALKRRLASRYGTDREGYTEAKTKFIRLIEEITMRPTDRSKDG